MKKKRARKSTFRVQRGYVGATLDEIKRKRSMKPEQKVAAREAALREVKDRKQKQKAHAVAVRSVAGGMKGQKTQKRATAGKSYTAGK